MTDAEKAFTKWWKETYPSRIEPRNDFELRAFEAGWDRAMEGAKQKLGEYGCYDTSDDAIKVLDEPGFYDDYCVSCWRHEPNCTCETTRQAGEE